MEPTTNTENTKPAPLTPPAIPPSRGVTYRRFDNKRDNFRSGGDRRDGFRGGERRDGRSFNRDNQNNRPFNKQPEKKESLGNPEPGVVRIIPLGGVEEIGRNMTVIETTNDMVVIDMGFAFQDESTPGVDYLLPNTAYIEARKHKVRAVIITHAHLDHIGAIPYLMRKLGNPPMYTREFTSLLVKKRQEEFPHEPQIDMRLVTRNENLQFGEIKIKLFAVTHSVPDSMGIIIETVNGDIVYATDLRLDHEGGIPNQEEQAEFSTFDTRKVKVLLTDSTNVEAPGFSTSNSVVLANIEKIIRETQGRLIVSMFASMVDRMLTIFEAAEKNGKKVVVDGRSMKTNLEIIKLSGLFKINPETIVPIEEMYKYPENKLVILVTGSQGEEFGALMRIANKSHKYIAGNQNDTILMSSSIIPGNERGVQKLKDLLARQGVYIIHNKMADVHASGHANRDELAWIITHVNPEFFIPIHGHHYMLRVNGKLAESLGVDKDKVVIPDNGSIIELSADGTKLTKLKEKADSKTVFVDGFSVGDVQEVVLRDRSILASDGVFVTSAIVETKTGRLLKSPDVVSRGFIYLKDSQELLRQVRILIRKKIEDTRASRNIESDELRNELNDTISKFFVKKTGKSPIVMSIINFV
jgi:ribonuclease J